MYVPSGRRTDAFSLTPIVFDTLMGITGETRQWSLPANARRPWVSRAETNDAIVGFCE